MRAPPLPRPNGVTALSLSQAHVFDDMTRELDLQARAHTPIRMRAFVAQMSSSSGAGAQVRFAANLPNARHPLHGLETDACVASLCLRVCPLSSVLIGVLLRLCGSVAGLACVTFHGNPFPGSSREVTEVNCAHHISIND